MRRAVVSLCMVLLAAWSAAQGEGSGGPEQDAVASQRGNMTVLKDSSVLWAVTRRAGLLGFLGHDHAITAERWSATLCWLEDDPARSFIVVTIPTSSLRIDTARGKELAGLESSPDPSTIEDLQRRMLSQEFLHADRFPELRFRSTQVSLPDDDAGDVDLRVAGEMSIHGRTQEISFPVRIERASTGTFTFSVQLSFLQTDFAITPENTAGIVAVADEMELFLEIEATRTRADCAS